MIVSIRLEAEGHDLDTVVSDLDSLEKAVMAQQHKKKDDFEGPVPLNTGVTDEHYERANKKGTTYFKGRRVIKFLGVATWDDYEPPTQPRMIAAFNGISSTSVTTTA